MNRALLVAAVLSMFVTSSIAAQESPQLDAAKDLYASARYDEALTVLNGLRRGSGPDRRSIEQYRSLCLLALGRANEAEKAIADAITADPLYRPGDEASPRVRAMFSEVRKRMLPEIATSQYAVAKASYDRQDWPLAEQQFRIVLSLLEDADSSGKLSDLRLLVVGFLELSARSAAPPPEPMPSQPQTPTQPPAQAQPQTEPSMALGRSVEMPTASLPESAARMPVAGRVYTADDGEVAPPVVVKQEIPSVPAPLIAMARPRGLLEIVIDEKGRVVGMAMRTSIHPSFDNQVLAAARDWKYKPALLDGHPVRFKKLIQVSVKR